MATLERAVLASAKDLFANKKLRLKDILEWSTGEVKPESDAEVVAQDTTLGVSICVAKENDKRPRHNAI